MEDDPSLIGSDQPNSHEEKEQSNRGVGATKMFSNAAKRKAVGKEKFNISKRDSRAIAKPS